MSVNKYQPHVLVLPEDDANRQMANGFLLHESLAVRKIQILEEVGGWTAVLERFSSDHIAAMDRYPERFMVLLIDFDDQAVDRLDKARSIIPPHLTDRVFVLGAKSNPEALKASLGPYETIGLAMAKDCRESTDTIWTNPLLQHNQGELDRLRRRVRPILFGIPFA